MDLSPKALNNHHMGLVFEELIRRFAESSNETAGEHFTPRDIVHLTTALLFTDQQQSIGPGKIVAVYDPTAGKLLKEKRQAVISLAVTKGLNPGAPMKDSGVEWLGEVPAHWVVKRLKHISPRIGVGLVINPSAYVTDEGVPFLFGGDVLEYGFKLENTRKMTREHSNLLRQSRLSAGDLVCVRVGYPGITAVVTPDLEGANCASIMVIKAGSFDSDWFCYAMNCWVGRRQVERVQYGAAQKQYNIGDAIEFVFPIPPVDEQSAIADFLNERFKKFDELIKKAEEAIVLQREHRTALISAAVTGKIDVRGWQKPNTHPEKAANAVNV